MSVSSLTITFSALGEGADSVQIELDDELNGDRSQFVYGEVANFLVFLDDSKYDYQVFATDGVLINNGSRTVNRDFDYQFVDTPIQSLQYPINDILSYQWYGNNLGAITKNSLFEVKCAITPDPSNGTIGIGDGVISTTGHSHGISIQDKPLPEYPVLIIVYTTAKA
jgi:hypothetical protein